jgi:hypothetical protein
MMQVSNTSFYFDELCPKINFVYGLMLFVALNEKVARAWTMATYESMSSNLAAVEKADDFPLVIARHSWAAMKQSEKPTVDMPNTSPLKVFAKLDWHARIVLMAVTILELPLAKVTDVYPWDSENLMRMVVQANKFLAERH